MKGGRGVNMAKIRKMKRKGKRRNKRGHKDRMRQKL